MFRSYSAKKVIKSVLVMLLTISFFTFGVTKQPPVNAVDQIDTSKKVELKWLVIGNRMQEDTALVEKEINKYLKDKINATLKLTTFSWGDDFEQNIQLRVASGDQFDITFTANWALNYRDNAKKGTFVDITDMMETYAPKTKAILGENILKGAQVDGRVYAIPVYKATGVSQGVLLNRKMVEKYKVDTSKIKKIEDLEPIFKKIKAKQPKVIGLYPFDYYGDESIYNILGYEKLNSNKFPGAIKSYTNNTKVLNDYETPEAKALFNLMYKWNKSGYINKSVEPDYAYLRENNSNIFAFYSYLNPLRCHDLSTYNDIDTVPVELKINLLTTSDCTGSMHAISSTSKNPERALMFLELVNTDEKLSNLINYGIENTHYKKIGAKTIESVTRGQEKYNPSTPWMFGNQTIAYSYDSEEPELWKDVVEFNNRAFASPLLGFTFDQKSVGTQVAKLNEVVKKYYSNLSMGKVDPAVYLPKMNSELKKAGLQKVLTEMQKQVDTFVKADY